MMRTVTTFALLAAVLAAAPISAYAHSPRADQGPVMNNNAPIGSLGAKAFFEQQQREGN